MNKFGETPYRMEGNLLAQEYAKNNTGMPNTSLCPVCQTARGVRGAHIKCSKILQRKFAGERQ